MVATGQAKAKHHVKRRHINSCRMLEDIIFYYIEHGKNTMPMIVKELNLPHSYIHRIVTGLSEHGLIQRIKKPGHRAYLLSVVKTEDGNKS